MFAVNMSFLGLRDPISSLTHFVAFFWAILATRVLWRMADGNRQRQLAVACFGVSMIVLYFASALYHAVLVPPDKLRYFLLLDHSAIYLLIAGTYTPAFLVLLRPRLRKHLLLGAVWTIGIAGIIAKWSLPRGPAWLEASFYLAMGWMAIVAIAELAQALGFRGMLWVLAGGVFYTVGCIIDIVHWPVIYPGVFGTHEIFHLFDMAGSYCHFVFMVKFVIPFRGYATAVDLPSGMLRAS